MPCHRMDGEVNPAVVKPNTFDEMVRLARILCKPFPVMRIDFYSVESRIYVGEMTFLIGTGFESFYPKSWNLKVGDMLKLPERRIIDTD